MDKTFGIFSTKTIIIIILSFGMNTLDVMTTILDDN